jgi:hypothetical protein
MTFDDPDWVFDETTGWLYGSLPDTRIRQPLIFFEKDEDIWYAKCVTKLLNETDATGPHKA